jgi:hypothetical protein
LSLLSLNFTLIYPKLKGVLSFFFYIKFDPFSFCFYFLFRVLFKFDFFYFIIQYLLHSFIYNKTHY